MSKKNTKRTFEDVSGNNCVFLSEVVSYEGNQVNDNEFAFVIEGVDNEEISVTIIPKSDIPRLINQLLKIMVSKPKKAKTKTIAFTPNFSDFPNETPF